MNASGSKPELSALDYARNAAHARKVTERINAAHTKSNNWRHAGSNYPSG